MDPRRRSRRLQKVLHRLRVNEGVKPWDIAVLTGAGSRIRPFRHVPGRQFGNEVLGNPAVDDAGRSLGVASRDVPELPSDMILFDTIRRFKGLERPVIILVELSSDDSKMLDRLLYVGGSRARQHLVAIGTTEVLARLSRG